MGSVAIVMFSLVGPILIIVTPFFLFAGDNAIAINPPSESNGSTKADGANSASDAVPVADQKVLPSEVQRLNRVIAQLQSEKDSVNINKIEKFFRKYLYPEVTGFVAKYPPLFSIKFFDEGESDENPYFPMIHDCYLTGVDVTINPEGNSFYKTARGKAPASTTMALSFQESRLLSRHDIFKEGTLDYDPGRPNSSSIDAAGSSDALAKETSETS